jgi:hypothetical protein
MEKHLFSTVFLGFCPEMPYFRWFLADAAAETRNWSGFYAP